MKWEFKRDKEYLEKSKQQIIASQQTGGNRPRWILPLPKEEIDKIIGVMNDLLWDHEEVKGSSFWCWYQTLQPAGYL